MHGDRDVFLPFWDYVRVVVASVEYVAFFGMAVFCVCSDIGDGNSDRRTREGNRLFRGLKLGDASHLMRETNRFPLPPGFVKYTAI